MFGNSAPPEVSSGGDQCAPGCVCGRGPVLRAGCGVNRPSANIWVGAYTFNRFAVAWAQVLLIRCLSKDIGRQLPGRAKIPHSGESLAIPRTRGPSRHNPTVQTNAHFGGSSALAAAASRRWCARRHGRIRRGLVAGSPLQSLSSASPCESRVRPTVQLGQNKPSEVSFDSRRGVTLESFSCRNERTDRCAIASPDRPFDSVRRSDYQSVVAIRLTQLRWPLLCRFCRSRAELSGHLSKDCPANRSRRTCRTLRLNRGDTCQVAASGSQACGPVDCTLPRASHAPRRSSAASGRAAMKRCATRPRPRGLCTPTAGGTKMPQRPAISAAHFMGSEPAPRFFATRPSTSSTGEQSGNGPSSNEDTPRRKAFASSNRPGSRAIRQCARGPMARLDCQDRLRRLGRSQLGTDLDRSATTRGPKPWPTSASARPSRVDWRSSRWPPTCKARPWVTSRAPRLCSSWAARRSKPTPSRARRQPSAEDRSVLRAGRRGRDRSPSGRQSPGQPGAAGPLHRQAGRSRRSCFRLRRLAGPLLEPLVPVSAAAQSLGGHPIPDVYQVSLRPVGRALQPGLSGLFAIWHDVRSGMPSQRTGDGRHCQRRALPGRRRQGRLRQGDRLQLRLLAHGMARRVGSRLHPHVRRPHPLRPHQGRAGHPRIHPQRPAGRPQADGRRHNGWNFVTAGIARDATPWKRSSSS